MSDIDAFEPARRIRTVCEGAAQVQVDPSIPAKRYFRSTIEMERMAKVYIEEGNMESALILYMRLISILVEKLPKHPLYSQIPVQDVSTRKKKLVNTIFPTAEKIKSRLKEQYGKEYEALKQQQLESKSVVEASAPPEDDVNDVGDHHQEPGHQNTAASATGERSHFQLDNGKRTAIASPPQIPSTLGANVADYDAPPVIIGQAKSEQAADAAVMPLGSPTLSSPTLVLPTINRSCKPDHLLSKQVSVDGLRSVQYSQQLPSKFLELASGNTARDIETCGVLCGKLSQGKFIITHLVLLKQSGTANSCTTENEEELFDIQDRNDLITLGWIHTHPSQTSFLSSVDLHTQFSYQQLLPEAIAIVCAPKRQQTGVYCLTPDHGLPTIASCRENGFHFHSKNPPLFMECKHTLTSGSVPLAVVDVR